MTISTTTARVAYTGDDATVNFAVPFVFFGTTSTAELEVIERTITTGAEVTKTNVTDYTVSGGSGSTGTVTAVTAPASTVQWIIRRNTTRTQTTDYTANDAFPAETHETALDRALAISQEIEETVGRALVFPKSDSSALSAEIPSSVDRASKFLGFDASGEPIASAGSVDTVAVSTFMETLLDDTTAAAGRTTLGALGDLVGDTTPQLGGMLDVNGNAIGDGTLELLTFTETGSAVNHVNITNAATGNGPIIAPAGDDANVPLNLVGKGSSKVQIGDASLTFPDADGSNGQALVTDGSGNLSFGDLGGWELVEVSTPTTNGFVLGEGNISSGYDYAIKISQMKWSADVSARYPGLQFGTGGGPTYQTSGYQTQTLRVLATTPAAEEDAITAAIAMSGVTPYGGDASDEFMHAWIEIDNPAASQVTWARGTSWGIYTSTGFTQFIDFAGWRSTAEVVTGFRIIPGSTQTVDSGTVMLFRRKRSV